jgi:hypothetical protein
VRRGSLIGFCSLAVVTFGMLVAPTTLAWGCGGSVAGACALPGGLTDPIAITAGGDHGLAVKADGTVVAWGCGFNFGQCNVPGGLVGVTAVAASLPHSLALKGDGTVVAWGCGSTLNRGQCSVPVGLAEVTAVAAGTYHSLALKSDGTVVAWGCGAPQNYLQCDVPIGLAGVTAVAAGTVHSLALKSDGTVVAWGCGSGSGSGQCDVPVALAGVIAVAAGRTQSLALKSDGTVVAWGCGSLDFGQCAVPGGLAGVTAISAAYGHSVALRGDGTVIAWGCGAGHDFGQCKVPAALGGVTAIAAGDFHTLTLAALRAQTISFDPIANRTWGAPGFVPSATASSGLPVSFSVSGACILINEVVYATSGGSCTVTASQPGGLNFNPAPDLSRTFTIARVGQSITFPPLGTKRFGDPDFVVSAFSGSGLPVSFGASGSCSVNGVIVHLTGSGSCTITASQAGDANWEPAPAVSQTFAIERAVQTIVPRPAARCRVPALVGRRLVAARRMIATRHCRTGNVSYAYSRKHKKGIVISQSRRPGRVLPARSKIGLIVSRGRRR